MSSYKTIIKSTGLVGIIQVFKIFFGLLQNKVLAIIIGPAGFGIWGLYNSFVVMVSSFSTLGIDQAGVREISKNAENTDKISETIWIFRAALLFLSSVSCIIVIVFCEFISISLFGAPDYKYGVIIIAFAILLNGLTQGNISILNGFRNLKSLAKSQIIGAFAGAIFAIMLVFYLKDKGIPFFIVIVSFIAFVASLFYVNKLRIQTQRPSFDNFKKQIRVLISIGIGIAYSAIIVALSTYFIQVYIRKEFGLEYVGIYNASFTISNVYVGIILSAMGIDLMPRLAKIFNDNTAVNRLVNEQMELGVLVSSIGIIGVILFAPLVLSLLYSDQFLAGIEIIRWQILGVSLRVLGFPLSYVLIVKNSTIKYMISQTIVWFGNYLLLILLSPKLGTTALGINYFVAYIVYIIVLYLFIYKIFKPSKFLQRIYLISCLFIASAWLITSFLSGYKLVLSGAVILCLNVIWIVFYLKKMGIAIPKIK